MRCLAMLTDKQEYIGEKTMIGHEHYSDYQNYYEYHGNTMIEITRKRMGVTIKRDWILFDTVEEAQEFFHDQCDEAEVNCVH